MGFLVDTSIWVAVERGAISAEDIFSVTGQHPVYVSPVNIAELRLGVELIKDTHRHQRGLAMLKRLRRKPVLRIDALTAETFGEVSAELRRQGRGERFRVMDVWLAAQAIQRDFTLLTSNRADFEDVPGLRLQVLEP